LTNPSKNSFFIFVAFVIGALTNYIFNVSMGWLLTPEQYGMLGVSVSFFIIFSLFVTSAFPLTVTKFLSGKHEESVKHRVFKSALTGNIAIALIVSIIFYLGYATGIIDLGADYGLLVIGVILATVISSALVVYMSVLQATFRFGAFGIIGILSTFIKLVSAVVLVHLGLGALGAVLSLPISGFVCLTLAFVLTKDFNFWKAKGWAGSNIYFFALPMFFGTLGTTLLMNIDILGVKFLTEGALSDALLGYYRAALILAQLPIFFTGAMMSVIFPYISKYAENEMYPAKSIKYAALFILPVALVIATIPGAFISIMFPSEYLAGAKALSIVAIGMGCLVLVIVLTFIFQAQHKPKIPAIVLSIAVLIEIILLLTLVPLYGIEGAATSTALACGFGLVVLALQYARTYRSTWDFMAIIKTLLSFGVLLILIYVLPHTGIFSFMADLIVSANAYVIILAIFNLLTEEDISIFVSGLPDNRLLTPVSRSLTGFIKALNR
jgi:stage V sporulation protein B